MSKHKIIVGTPHRADLHIEVEISVNKSGNLEIDGIPGVTYEMYNSELCLFAFSQACDTPELNYSGLPKDFELILDGKPLKLGDEYFDLDRIKLTLTKKTLTKDSKWEGQMFWTIDDAVKDMKLSLSRNKDLKNKIIQVYDDAKPELIRITL